MNLTINGENRSLAPVESLHALIEQLGMKSDRVAIELNREIVPRDQWAQTPIRDGDRLEIVHFVGGGSSAIARRKVSTRSDDDPGTSWRPRPELNRNSRFRKPVLYPFELRGRAISTQFSHA